MTSQRWVGVEWDGMLLLQFCSLSCCFLYCAANPLPATLMTQPRAACLACLQEDPTLTSTWKKTMKVAVTGAAGQISNHLLFMLASGEVFGRDQPIALQLLGSERSRVALEGVAMELEDRWAAGSWQQAGGADGWRRAAGAHGCACL